MNNSVVGSTCLTSEEVGNNDASTKIDPSPIGKCPSCRGLVYEFDDKFACVNAITGKCKFDYPKWFAEGLSRTDFGNMLRGPVKCYYSVVGKNVEIKFKYVNDCDEDDWGLNYKVLEK